MEDVELSLVPRCWGLWDEIRPDARSETVYLDPIAVVTMPLDGQRKGLDHRRHGPIKGLSTPMLLVISVVMMGEDGITK